MDAGRMLECFTELSAMTRMPRTGWILAGVTDPESIADHSFETALFAYILSKHANIQVDMKKVLLMALFHEVGEVRMADLPRRCKNYIGKAKRPAEREAALDILDGLTDEIVPLLDEMHDLSSPEARLVEAAEELQIIFRALIYAKEGRGDMSEYRNDVAKYNALGVEPAEKVSQLIKEKLEEYLSDKKYWEIGYRQRNK